MALQILKGIRKTAVRTCLYGVEGVGKSSLAALLPEPLFLDLEEGTHQLDVARTSIDSISGLNAALAELASNTQGFKTIVIDSADWAERLASEALIKKSGKKSIEDFGFGKGFVMLAEDMARTLAACDTLIHRGVHVVWIAHAKTQRVSPPDMVDGFDRYELKLAKQTAPLFKEWADLLLFANYETITVKGNDGRVKGSDTKRRILISERSAAWDAKNRFGLPEIMALEHGRLAPELAAVFSGKVTPRPISTPAVGVVSGTAESDNGSQNRDARTDGGAMEAEQATVTLPPPATAAQIAKITDYLKNSVGAKVIAAALDHYEALDASELTEEQAATVIARCQEDMNKAAEKPAKPAGPLARTAEPVFPWSPSFREWLGANEEKVNAFLVIKQWLPAGKTWRDLPAERAEQVVEREGPFAAAAGIPARKEGSS